MQSFKTHHMEFKKMFTSLMLTLNILFYVPHKSIKSSTKFCWQVFAVVPTFYMSIVYRNLFSLSYKKDRFSQSIVPSEKYPIHIHDIVHKKNSLHQTCFVCVHAGLLPNLDRIPDPFTMENMKSDQFSRGNDALIFIYNLDNIFVVEVFRLKAFIPR